MRFLIVDDNTRFCSEIEAILREGHAGASVAVDSCGDAATALQLIRTTPYNLVLLDISLGESNGLDLLRQLQRDCPALPVLVVSMHAESLYAKISLSLGAAGYLEKRHLLHGLTTIVTKIIAAATPAICSESIVRPAERSAICTEGDES